MRKHDFYNNSAIFNEVRMVQNILIHFLRDGWNRVAINNKLQNASFTIIIMIDMIQC